MEEILDCFAKRLLVQILFGMGWCTTDFVCDCICICTASDFVRGLLFEGCCCSVVFFHEETLS